jgi:hypothetical protein
MKGGSRPTYFHRQEDSAGARTDVRWAQKERPRQDITSAFHTQGPQPAARSGVR